MREERTVLQDVTAGLFDKQLDVVNDSARFISVLCSRRAGKTFLVTRALIKTCLDFPGTTSAYITLTRGNAKKLVWRPLLEINRQHKLGIKFNHSELIAEFPNGSFLMVTGASDEPDIEKLRGPAYKMVAIDECASFPAYIEPLIDEVLEPALEDYAGTLLVIGTPAARCSGYFYDVTTDPDKAGYSHYHWTVQDNSMFPLWANQPEWRDMVAFWLKALMKRKSYEETTPKFMREYLGIWVAAEDDMMYHIKAGNYMTTAESLILDERITDKDPMLTFVLGMDLGWHDKTAFVVGAYDQVSQTVFEVERIARKGLTVEDIMHVAEELVKSYDPERIVIDSAGEGKIIINSLAVEITKRYGVAVKAAEKSKKASFVRLLDSDLRIERFKFRPGSPAASQMKRLQWDDKFLREREGVPADLADATLYMYRECLHWAKEDAPDVAPAYGSKEYIDQMLDKMEREEMDRALADNTDDPDWYDLDNV